jgi:hypothetical protein
MATITAVEIFLVQAPGPYVKKLFTTMCFENLKQLLEYQNLLLQISVVKILIYILCWLFFKRWI